MAASFTGDATATAALAASPFCTRGVAEACRLTTADLAAGAGTGPGAASGDAANIPATSVLIRTTTWLAEGTTSKACGPLKSITTRVTGGAAWNRPTRICRTSLECTSMFLTEGRDRKSTRLNSSH